MRLPARCHGELLSKSQKEELPEELPMESMRQEEHYRDMAVVSRHPTRN